MGTQIMSRCSTSVRAVVDKYRVALCDDGDLPAAEYATAEDSMPAKILVFVAILFSLTVAAVAAPSTANAALDPWCAANGISDADCMSYMCGELGQQQYCQQTDACPNLPGVVTVPAGYIVDANGDCVLPQNPPPPPPPPVVVVDLCPNLAGNQDAIPAGLTLDAAGNCTAPSVDDTPVAGEEAVPETDSSVDVEPPVVPHGSGELPFTGANLAIWLVVGFLLTISGMVMHRVARRKLRTQRK
jgi:hypothetical protein